MASPDRLSNSLKTLPVPACPCINSKALDTDSSSTADAMICEIARSSPARRCVRCWMGSARRCDGSWLARRTKWGSTSPHCSLSGVRCASSLPLTTSMRIPGSRSIRFRVVQGRNGSLYRLLKCEYNRVEVFFFSLLCYNIL